MNPTSANTESTTSGFERPQVEASYHEFLRAHWGEIDIPRLCEFMWNRGGREMFTATEGFADLQRTLRYLSRRTEELAAVVETLTRPQP